VACEPQKRHRLAELLTSGHASDAGLSLDRCVVRESLYGLAGTSSRGVTL
jgi:hypothetical protein